MKHHDPDPPVVSAEPVLAAATDLRHAAEQAAELRAAHEKIVNYVRNKVNQLLCIIGTLPLKPEELDDETLISLDPIGIVAESFGQVLDHLKDTNEDLLLARDEVQAIFDSAGAAIIVVDTEMRVSARDRLRQYGKGYRLCHR